MAKNPSQIGALGNLTQDQYNSLSTGFSMKNPTGLSLGGIGFNKGNVVSGLANLAPSPLSYAASLGSTIAQYNAEKAAQSSLGQNKSFLDTSKNVFGFGNSSLGTARDIADTNKDGKVSTKEAQNFGMNKGLTAYNVGRNPMQGYTPGTVNVNTLGKIDPTGGVVGGYESKTVSPTVYTQQQVDNITSGVGQGVGATGDLGGATGAGYSGSTGGFLGFGKTEGVDTSQSQQTGDQTSVTDTTGGKDLSNTFSDDAGTSSDSGGTYICTALYEMGDMKKSIYKYDQIYGKRVDPNVYRGYCVWGKYVATKLRARGIVYKIAKPLALGWARQMAFDLSKGKHGKNNKVVKVISRIGESVCYALGVIANIKLKKGVRYG